MAKRHTIQTHIGDYLRDPASNCSLAAQGLLRHLEFLMSDGDRFGFLTRDGKPISTQFLMRSVKGVSTAEEIELLLRELEAASVLRRHVGDILSCPAMIADQQRRAEAAQNGRRGGNPRLRGENGQGVNPPLKGTLNPPLNPPLNLTGQLEVGNKGMGDARGKGAVAVLARSPDVSDDDPAVPDPERARALEFVREHAWIDTACDRQAVDNVQRLLALVSEERAVDLIRQSIRQRATWPTKYALGIVQKEMQHSASKPKHRSSDEWKKMPYVGG